MKVLIMLALVISSVSFADEIQLSQEESKSTVQESVKEGKSSRKKKVEMCHECGRPESQCDCVGEEHKKDGAVENDQII